jgi:predicted XRE-type DNA-binding protein
MRSQVSAPDGFSPIAEREDRYAVSREGEVLSFLSDKNLKPSLVKRGKGYWHVQLWRDNKGHHRYLHQLVAQAFVPNPEGKETVNHGDGDTSNNRASNLEWATHQEQQDHAWGSGLSSHCGEAGTNVKLTAAQVAQVPELLAGGLSQYKIGAMFGVNQSQISRIANGLRWQRALSQDATCSK